MRLPRTETTLAAVLLLSAAPFALATPPGSAEPSTPGATAPETTPSTTNPSTMNPHATPPGETPPEEPSPGATQPGTANPGATGTPGTSQPESEGSQGSKAWSHHYNSHMRTRSTEQVPQADIDAAKNAKVSLTDAINTAEQEHHGNVISARFEVREGKPEYLIRAFNADSQEEWLGHVDANTGQLIGQGRTTPLSQLPKEVQQELTAAQSASGTSLGHAVQNAEQQSGGKALAAGLTTQDGKASYRMELLKSDGSTQMAMINPQSGEVSRYR